MGEPKNAKPQEATDAKHGKIDMSKRKMGSIPKDTPTKAPHSGTKEMDLSDVDNDNKENYQDASFKKNETGMKNIDFIKAGEDYSLQKVYKKPDNAGE